MDEKVKLKTEGEGTVKGRGDGEGQRRSMNIKRGMHQRPLRRGGTRQAKSSLSVVQRRWLEPHRTGEMAEVDWTRLDSRGKRTSGTQLKQHKAPPHAQRGGASRREQPRHPKND